MARLIKNTQKAVLGMRLSTVFENETVDRNLKTGDIVEGLRYVKDGDVITVSGRIVEIRYKMASRLAWNKKAPADTLADDMLIDSLVLDVSEQYNSRLIAVPAREIVEFADETNVVRMKFEPFITYEMELKYSDLKEQNVSIEVGDVFDNVRIMNIISGKIGPDITGKFEVIGFSYALDKGKIAINGIAFKDVETEEVQVAELGHILALNEVYTYALDDGNITETVANLADGDTIAIDNEIDATETPLTINKQNITVKLNANLMAASSYDSGIVVENGSATLSGEGLVVTETPYGSGHSSGVINVCDGGELVFNGSGISAVIEDDPVNKGQFGITVTGNGKLTINDGDFTAGWYCVSGNGSTTKADAVTTINGGEFKSVADYAIYHPGPDTLIINGGTIVGAAGAIAANNGTIEINGGTFAVLGGGNTGEWADGTSGLSDVALNLNAKYGDVVCRITDGEFHATAAGTIMIRTGNGHTVDLQISGGKFTSKPNDEWIAEGYVCSETADAEGFFTVTAA